MADPLPAVGNDNGALDVALAVYLAPNHDILATAEIAGKGAALGNGRGKTHEVIQVLAQDCLSFGCLHIGYLGKFLIGLN